MGPKMQADSNQEDDINMPRFIQMFQDIRTARVKCIDITIETDLCDKYWQELDEGLARWLRVCPTTCKVTFRVEPIFSRVVPYPQPCRMCAMRRPALTLFRALRANHASQVRIERPWMPYGSDERGLFEDDRWKSELAYPGAPGCRDCRDGFE